MARTRSATTNMTPNANAAIFSRAAQPAAVVELTPGPGVGRGFVPPTVEQRSLAVYEEVADVTAI
jgi:hypothetical protein